MPHLQAMAQQVIDTLISQSPLIISGLMVLETILVIHSYPEYHFGQPQEIEAARSRAQTLRGRALALVGMAFAGFSILLTVEDEVESLTVVFRLLALSVGLLFISYQVKEFTPSKEGWRIVQEKTLAYGFLTLFLTTAAVYSFAVESFPWILSISLIVASGLRFWTVKDQIRMYRKMRSKTEDSGNSRYRYELDLLRNLIRRE